MSASELSSATIPHDGAMEHALRTEVLRALKNGEQPSVNSVRSAVEHILGLDTGFLKSSSDWKERSKNVISNAVDAYDIVSSPEKPKKAGPVKSMPKAGTKRKPDELQEKKAKRRKKSTTPDKDSDVLSEASHAPKKQPIKKSAASKRSSERVDSEESVIEGTPPVKTHVSHLQQKNEETSGLSEPSMNVDEPISNGAAAAVDSSDLSSVLDDPPPKKKRQKAITAKADKPAKPAKAKPSDKELSPAEEEIKRLQSWLLKCGIRKLWHRELASCSTPEEKIKHLKNMLSDVGMDGRYNGEKAKQIKEARELAAELEAAKEFEKQWGHESEEQEDGEKKARGREASQPRKLVPRGLVDFGDSGEDSD